MNDSTRHPFLMVFLTALIGGATLAASALPLQRQAGRLAGLLCLFGGWALVAILYRLELISSAEAIEQAAWACVAAVLATLARITMRKPL